MLTPAEIAAIEERHRGLHRCETGYRLGVPDGPIPQCDTRRLLDDRKGLERELAEARAAIQDAVEDALAEQARAEDVATPAEEDRDAD